MSEAYRRHQGVAPKTENDACSAVLHTDPLHCTLFKGHALPHYATRKGVVVPFEIKDEAEPEEREPIAMLCKHEDEPKILQARFGCADDEPLYPGDRVHTVTTISGIIVAGQATRLNDDEAWIERG